ncbi:sulfatase [Fodinibius sediminis]|nr:sulfatase [Fodinibius sediminis]
MLRPVHAQNSVDRPNILFIGIDDYNDWAGVLETHPQVITPNIDRLAERGTLFTNAHVQAPVCNPSRVSLLTGLRPSTTGIYGLAPGHREAEPTKEVVTLPQYFAQHGYHTYSTGKIFHNVSDVTKETDFEEWGPGGSFGPFPENKLVDKPLDMVDHPLVDWGIFPEEDSAMGDYKVANWAVNQLEELGQETDEEPFFLAVGFVSPHVPLYSTKKWFDLYPAKEKVVLPSAPEGDRDDIPDFAWYTHWFLPEPRLSWVIENEEWHSKGKSYLATVSFMDAQVGRLLDTLEKEGLAENTIVVFWSDHGYHLGEKAITGKNTLWERTTHVPLIFAGPGVSAGAQSPEAVELLDMYPTLVELAGLPPKENIEGLSLVPQLENAHTPRERPALTTANPGNHAVRTERWRYIRYANGSEELYDHHRDPHEWSNLANNPEYADIKEKLAKWLPERSAPHVSGSKARILWEENGVWYWEGEPINFDKLIK